MTDQALASQLFTWLSGIVFVSLSIYILYKYMEYSRTEEFQEYELFKSEYDIYENRKRELIKRYEGLQKRMKRLELKLTQDLLNRELETTPVDTLVNAWKIGGKNSIKTLFFRL